MWCAQWRDKTGHSLTHSGSDCLELCPKMEMGERAGNSRSAERGRRIWHRETRANDRLLVLILWVTRSLVVLCAFPPMKDLWAGLRGEFVWCAMLCNKTANMTPFFSPPNQPKRERTLFSRLPHANRKQESRLYYPLHSTQSSIIEKKSLWHMRIWQVFLGVKWEIG